MPIRTRPTTNQLYWRFQYKGRTYEKSMETASRKVAQERGMAWEVEVKKQVEEPELYPTLAVLRDRDIDRLREKGRSEEYIRAGILAKYKNLLRFFPDTRAVTTASLEEYVKFRRREGVRAQTIRKELVCLKRGLRQMHLKGPDFWPKESSDPQDARLASKGHDLRILRQWLANLGRQRDPEALQLALFALVTGLRFGELYRVQPEDVQWLNEYCVLQVHEKIRRTHQRKVVLGPIGQSLVDVLPFRREHRTGFSLAVPDTSRANITLRDCRAAFRSAAGISGDPDAANLAMGHSGIPSLYIKEHYDRLYRVALAAENWLYPWPTTGTVAGVPAIHDFPQHLLSD